MNRSQRRDLTTAYHEAGHVVVGHCQGLPARRATIEAGDWYHGLTKSARFPRSMQPDAEMTVNVRHRLECEVRILLAGATAQRRIAPRSMRHLHHQTDYENAVSCIDYLCSSGSDRELRAYIKLLQIQIEDLVELHWPEVQTVAKALIERRTLSGPAMREVMREASAS
jgi:hypothetical protein